MYYEIQQANSSRDRMWDIFSGAVSDLREASVSNDDTRFVKLMDAGRAYFEN